MSIFQAVYTADACAPLPQFSQAVKYNGMVYCSGSIGIDPATDDLVPGSVTDRARMALKNLQAVLEAAGSSLDRVVKANVFLADMKDFGAFSTAWDEFFPTEPKPCRTCVAVHQLPLNTDVEIEVTASYQLQ
ncbi:endoribonuclease L-PSP [Fusarium proliferatum]|uniref:Endoribonuclease L-PSP n=1 Tax=Gibberella intermedia TaxID=948311 RepID=A0A365MPC8_GIBIN|nr:endoribonuclease L-PSP [Fusarium proliferatum]